MNASVLWDIVSQAKIEWHEAAGRVALYLARDAISPGHEHVLEHGHTHEEVGFSVQIVFLHFNFFSSHVEITLLFCLQYFRYCTHAFELQCF